MRERRVGPGHRRIPRPPRDDLVGERPPHGTLERAQHLEHRRALAGTEVDGQHARLEVLDLSMGTLGDDGAAALLGGQPLTHLRKLDLHHNYLSEPLLRRLRETLGSAGVELDLDRDDADWDEDDDGTVHRYVAVGE